MKNIYKYSIVLLAALLCAPMTTLADVDPNDPSITRGNGVVLKKTVRDATTDEKGEYILTLEAYATGTSATVITEETDAQTIPCDIVLLLDESGSMRSNWFIQNVKGTQVSASNLEADKVYIVNIDGKDYYMKGFRSNEDYVKVPDVYGDIYTSAGTNITYNGAYSNSYYIIYNGNYYLVKCTTYTSYGSTYYALYIEVNGTRRYLSGTSTQTNQTGNRKNTNNIWTGEKFTKSQGNVSSLSFNSVCPSANNIPTATVDYNANPYAVTLASTDYYVKYTDGKYYRVEPCYYNWNGSNTYYLTINIGDQKKYLSGATFSTASTGSNNRTSDIWTGDVYTKSASGNITFVYNETIPTSATDGTVISPASATVYSTSTQFITREQIAKAAAQDFVQTVLENNPKSGDPHSLAVGSYSNTFLGWCNGGLVQLNDETAESMKTAIGNVDPHGETGTRIDLAMQNAYNLLNTENDAVNYKNDSHNKIVVLFTDGEPGTSSKTFSASVARTAVNYANQIKDEFDNTFEGNTYEAKVYSIGFLDKETSNSNSKTGTMAYYDIRRFLHYLSSNYNIGTSLTINGDPNPGMKNETAYGFNENYSGAGGGDEAPHDYYIYSDGSNLSTIFQTVASQAASGQTTGGASRQLEANTTTVLDIISEEFRLPTDITTTVDDFVKVYTMHVVSDESSENNYVWDMDDDSQAAPTIAYSKEEGTQNDIVRVNGFDFTKADEYNEDGTDIVTYGHWVGPREIGNTTTYAGHKLVIEIPIIKADNYNGGFNTPTNTSSSALVYVNPDTNKEEKVLAFAIPDLDFPSLAVAKSGLEPGESAIFTVKQLSGWNEDGTALVEVENGISYTVIVTNDGTEITRNISGVTDVNGSLSKTVNDTEYWYEIIKDIPEGMYQVTETPWSWTYTTTIPQHESYTTVGTNVIKQLVTKSQITANHNNGDGEFKGWGDNITKKIIIFEFNNSKKESNPAHGEDSKKNVFKGVGANGGNTDVVPEL